MAQVIIGKPTEEPQLDESRPAFYIHKNLICYLDTRPDGVWVLGADPKLKKVIFEKHFSHAGEAMGYIEAKKKYFGETDESAEHDGTGKA